MGSGRRAKIVELHRPAAVFLLFFFIAFCNYFGNFDLFSSISFSFCIFSLINFTCDFVFVISFRAVFDELSTIIIVTLVLAFPALCVNYCKWQSIFCCTINQCTISVTAAALGTAETLMLLILQKSFVWKIGGKGKLTTLDCSLPQGDSSCMPIKALTVAFGKDLLSTAQSANNSGEHVIARSTTFNSDHVQLLQYFFWFWFMSIIFC